MRTIRTSHAERIFGSQKKRVVWLEYGMKAGAFAGRIGIGCRLAILMRRIVVASAVIPVGWRMWEPYQGASVSPPANNLCPDPFRDLVLIEDWGNARPAHESPGCLLQELLEPLHVLFQLADHQIGSIPTQVARSIAGDQGKVRQLARLAVAKRRQNVVGIRSRGDQRRQRQVAA